MKKQHFRGVVWPRRGPVDGTYQYVIAAIVVTDHPIPVGTDDGYLDGNVSELFLEELRHLSAHKPTEVFGDASNVLLRLSRVDPRKDKRIPNDGGDVVETKTTTGAKTRKKKV